jgi:hypothetical protein
MRPNTRNHHTVPLDLLMFLIMAALTIISFAYVAGLEKL